MSIFAVSGVALLCAVTVLVLRELRAPIAPLLRAFSVLLFLGLAMALLAPVLSVIRELFEFSGAGDYVSVLFRALGIAFVCELASMLCRDLGEGGIAEGVLFFGKLEILVLALPLVREILSLAKEMLSF